MRLRKRTWMLGAIMACAGAATAADLVAAGPPTTGPTPPMSYLAADGPTHELSWDNGTRRWSLVWYTGTGSWVGNDFDVSTLLAAGESAKLWRFKMYTRGDWPNTVWDGFRFAVYNYSGGVPGSMLWPTSGVGYFFKPASANMGHIWVECDINWMCPTTSFIVAEEQFYNNPNCDVFAIDSNPTPLYHSWQYYGGSWSRFSTSSVAPYRNIMIRVIVETDNFTTVAPTSLGRVKALYY
jgi:hypothetical protein